MSGKKTWLYVLGGIALMGTIVVAGLAAAGVFIARQHIVVENSTAESAERQFEDARRHLTDPPLITVGDDGKAVLNPARSPAPGTIDSLQVLMFNPRNRKLARLSIPVWLVKLSGRARIRLDGGPSGGRRAGDGVDVDWGEGVLTYDALATHGPGLVIDHTDGRGRRILVWAE